MNDQKTNHRLSPQRAIIIYHDKGHKNFYLESREIKNVEGKPQLMAPVPLSDNILKEVAKSYMKNKSAEMLHEPMISPFLLHGSNKVGKTVVIWYHPAMKRTLNFSASLKIKGESNVQIPACLYIVINTKLYIYALMTDERPDEKTKLFAAPFFNIYDDGNVCLGTAPVGKRSARTFEKEAQRFERAFYMAEQNGGQSELNCKTPLAKLWTGLIKNKTAFPSKKELKQHPKYKTLGMLMDKLIGNQQFENEEEDYFAPDEDRDG